MMQGNFIVSHNTLASSLLWKEKYELLNDMYGNQKQTQDAMILIKRIAFMHTS